MNLNSLTLGELRKLPEYKNLPPNIKKTKLNVDELRETIKNIIIQNNKFTCKANYTMDKNEMMSIIKASLFDYYQHGPRSSKKLDILHFYIKCLIMNTLKIMNQELYSKMTFWSQPGKEARVTGMLYKKYVDISVQYKNKHIGLVSVKFITSNYKQNANNYFENLLGECINLKKSLDSSKVFWYSLFVFENIPYYDKKNDLLSYETFKTDKYELLWNESLRNNFLPDVVSLTILQNTKNMIHPTKLSKEQQTDAELIRFIQQILPSSYKENPRHLQFYTQLKIFCKKIIKTIEDSYTHKDNINKRIKGIQSAD